MSIEIGFDSETFRKVMGHFVTGVTVVTTLEAGEARGITVNALSSVSLEPALVVVALDRRRSITPTVHAAGRFAVNVLGEHQEDLADCFAGAPVRPGREQFCGAAWSPGPTGLPLLDGAIATLECTLVGVHPIGDHDLFIGRVDSLASDQQHPQPLLYYRRHYLRVERSQAIAIEGRQEG
ncbi:MAG: flavin reductase family protein [Candidatus Limnocylindrales bacterium]